ncbi:MAG TPA: ABC transporter permease [Anaerovoracaceae bacterium]|nr:ABC transporter permease [Anaerovoracaceae bacterium]
MENKKSLNEFLSDDFHLATEEEKVHFIEMKESMSYWQDAWRRLKQNRVAMVALYIIIGIVLFAFLGPVLSPYDYTQQIRGAENIAPCWEHPFGTDNLGRDILVRTMFGTRVSLIIGVVASLIVLVIGFTYGAIAGYFGGRVDDVMMRFSELVYTVPDILVVLLLSTVLKAPLQHAFNTSNIGVVKSLGVLGPSLVAIFIAFGLIYWVRLARIIRGQVLMLKEQEFVTAAKALGAPSGTIIKKHLLPNCIGQIIVTTSLEIPTAIFLESFLSFLGLGVAPPMTSLGSLAAAALSGMYTYTYRLIIPSFILSVMILSLNLFGDGLRDALDPRLKK